MNIINKLFKKNYSQSIVTLDDPAFYERCVAHREQLIEFLETTSRLTCAKNLNKPTRRFVKSEIMDDKLSEILEIDYVDEVAYDAVWNGKKISIKTEQKAFQPKTRTTSQLAMANLAGANSESKIANVEFDYLLIISTIQKGIALAEKKDVEMKLSGSQLKTQISFEKLKFIIEPDFKAKRIDLNQDQENKINEFIKQRNANIYNFFAI